MVWSNPLNWFDATAAISWSIANRTHYLTRQSSSTKSQNLFAGYFQDDNGVFDLIGFVDTVSWSHTCGRQYRGLERNVQLLRERAAVTEDEVSELPIGEE